MLIALKGSHANDSLRDDNDVEVDDWVIVMAPMMLLNLNVVLRATTHMCQCQCYVVGEKK
jgi:hypothetical protein